MSDQNPSPRRFKYRSFPALFVIGLGVLLLLRNMGIGIPALDTQNWWAWLILITAAGPFGRAIELYRRDGGISGAVVHHLFVAASIVLVAVFFILGLSWRLWWPLVMILAGLAMLGRGTECRSDAGQAQH